MPDVANPRGIEGSGDEAQRPERALPNADPILLAPPEGALGAAAEPTTSEPSTLADALLVALRLARAEHRAGAAKELARILAELLGVDADERPDVVVDLALERGKRGGK